MINMNDAVAERGGLRLPHVQRQQPKHTASQEPVDKAKEDGDVYAKQGWLAAGYERFEYGYYNSKGEAVSTAGSIGVSNTREAAVGPDAAQKAEAAEKASALIENLKSEKNSINDIIKKHASGAGFSDSDMNKLKIEIDSSGKIIVGGIQDTQKAKALQESLNSEAGLAKRIKAYQNNEKSLKSFFTENNIGGLSLASGAKGLDHIKEIAQAGQSPDELGSILSDPLAVAAMELYGVGGPDFSSGSKGVADPKGALKSELEKAKKKIEELFTNANLQAEQLANEAGKPDGAFAADKMSLTGATIKISADGAISFEGRFAQSDSANSQAEAMIRMVLDEMFQQDGSGVESTLATAARQLVANHDDEHGEDRGKIAVMEISGKETNAYVDNPGKIILLNEDIKKNAAGFLSNESGSKITADMVSVDDNGKISLIGIPETMNAKQADNLVDMLNQDIKNAAKDPANANSDVAAKIAALLAEKAPYGHSGTPTPYAAAPSPADASSPAPSGSAAAAPATAKANNTNANTAVSAPSPHSSKEVREKRKQIAANQGATESKELRDAFNKWQNGEGDFRLGFLGMETEDGFEYRIGYGGDKGGDFLYRKEYHEFTSADGAKEKREIIVPRFSKGQKGGMVPNNLFDAMSGDYARAAEELKGITKEDTSIYDKTGLMESGLTHEERQDFLGMVDSFLKETGYSDFKASDFSFGYYLDVKEVMYRDGTVGTEPSGSATLHASARPDVESGYTRDEINELSSYLTDRIMQTDDFWNKGLAQKLANHALSGTYDNMGNQPFAEHYRWE